MFGTKIKTIAMAFTVGGTATLLSACGAIDETWEYVSTDNTLRTPTGYYEHAHAVEAEDPMKVPAALSTPYTDKSLDIANVAATSESRYMVGEVMDVRPPVVSRVNELGVDIRNQDNAALVWFLPYGNMNVRTTNDAWQYLGAALDYLKIPVAEVRADQMLLATASKTYNDYGQVYNESIDDDNAKFNQIYTVRVVSSNQGTVGLLITLVNSVSDAKGSSAILNSRQKRSFTTGFANELISALALQQRTFQAIPDYIEPVLGRDNNNQDAIIVNAPYEAVWNVMRGVLSQYGMEINEYSVSRSSITFTLEEEDADFYTSQGIRPFGLESNKYIVRIAVAGNHSVLTFYDEDDKPLSGVQVATLYNGFSAAIVKEFAAYKSEGANYLAKFADED